MSGSNFSDFYVYIHRRKDSQEIFYVGKGRLDRYKTRSGRSSYWRRVADKHGFTPEIVSSGMTEESAFFEELFLIASLRAFGVGLVNHSDGGGWGCTGYKHSDEALKKMSTAKVGRRLSDQHKANIRSAWRPRQKVTPAEAVARLMSAMYGGH